VSASRLEPGATRVDVAFVVASGENVGSGLARGLQRAGSRVALLDDTASKGDAGEVLRVPLSFGSRTDVMSAFATAVERVGAPRLVVQSVLPESLLSPTPITDLTPQEWASVVHGAAKSTLYCLQAAHSNMAQSGGGTIVCVGPSFALVGATGLVALSTVLEAQRALVKSAARQWGRQGIRVHWIALGVGENYPALAKVSLPNGPEIGPPPPPLGRIPDLAQDVVSIAEFLASTGGSGLTGASLVADGGDWMVP